MVRSNASAEARALREAALAFAGHASREPLDDEDSVGQKLNRRLMNAALAFGRPTSCPTSSLLAAIDSALATLLPAYFDASTDMSMTDWNNVLWTLIEAVCKARNIKAPRQLPETWPQTSTAVRHVPRRKHSRSGVVRCDLCAPLRCAKAP